MGGRGRYGPIALSLGLLVAANGVAVAAVVLGIGVLAPVSVGPAAVVPVTALLLAGVLAVEYAYVRRSGPAAFGSAKPDPDLSAVAARYAHQVGIPEPRVVVLDADDANAFSLGGLGTGTVVFTRGLCDRLDDRQVEAVVAHEVAHLRNGEALVASLAAFFPLFVRRLERAIPVDLASDARPDDGGDETGDGTDAERTDSIGPGAWIASLLPVVLGGGAVALVAVGDLDPRTVLAALSVVGVLVVGGALLAVPALYVGSLFALGFLRGITACTVAPLARQRELAADRAGARLCGDPSALATALEVLYDGGGGRPGEGGIPFLTITPGPLAPAATGTVGSRLASLGGSWVGLLVDPSFHPPLPERLDQLEELVREAESREREAGK